MTREEAFLLFQDAVRHVWQNHEFALVGVDLAPTPPARDVYAAVLRSRGKTWAVGDTLICRAQRARLQVADRLLEQPPEVVRQVLIHEACHLGHSGHGRDFRALCREKGGAVSESAIGGSEVKVERKVGHRYATIRTFPDEISAEVWGRQQSRENPGVRFRITY